MLGRSMEVEQCPYSVGEDLNESGFTNRGRDTRFLEGGKGGNYYTDRDREKSVWRKQSWGTGGKNSYGREDLDDSEL